MPIENIRREIVEFLISADGLMYGKGMEPPLTVDEVKLLELYIPRLCEKLHLIYRPSRVLLESLRCSDGFANVKEDHNKHSDEPQPKMVA
jgi:hypothetical protein